MMQPWDCLRSYSMADPNVCAGAASLASPDDHSIQRMKFEVCLAGPEPIDTDVEALLGQLLFGRQALPQICHLSSLHYEWPPVVAEDLRFLSSNGSVLCRSPLHREAHSHPSYHALLKHVSVVRAVEAWQPFSIQSVCS